MEINVAAQSDYMYLIIMDELWIINEHGWYQSSRLHCLHCEEI